MTYTHSLPWPQDELSLLDGGSSSGSVSSYLEIEPVDGGTASGSGVFMWDLIDGGNSE